MSSLGFNGFCKTMPTHQTDTEVLQSLKSGDLSALTRLYERYGEPVYRLCLRILGNVAEAEDVTQEVFLAFWRNLTYDPARGSLLVFLLTLARSRSINRLRQVRSQQQLYQRWEGHLAPHANSRSLMDHATLTELSERVGEALQQLPDTQRQVLEMAYYDGLSQSEITQRLNLPLGTVKTRSRQGLLKLRKLLNDWVES